ncbi:hypothetical protein ABI59_09995 [Acidobacteria bacterium Mor1]|nr:hypothetical protein ABI59_09995 [Acidobacteria bacterium Mor1]
MPQDPPRTPSEKSLDFEAIRGEVVRAVRAHCPPSMVPQADDLAQEVLVRLLERQKKGEVPEVRHASYWRRAAYNALIDELRRRRRRREELFDDQPPGGDIPATPSQDPDRRAESVELAEAIEDCLSRLTSGRRVAVFLHLQGHTTAEVAKILDWAIKRVGSALFRGMRDLRACLASKGWTA